MKFRRHHNNKGYRQIKRGKTRRQVQCLRAGLGSRTGAGLAQRSGRVSHPWNSVPDCFV